jgi:hypothetical protein
MPCFFLCFFNNRNGTLLHSPSNKGRGGGPRCVVLGLHPVPQGPGWVGLPRASVSACCLSRQRTQRIILTHQGPQSNGEADTLANKSCLYFSLARRVWFINPPEGMCNPVSIYIEGFCLKKPKNATHHPYACIALRCVPLAPLLAALCFEAGDEGGRA